MRYVILALLLSLPALPTAASDCAPTAPFPRIVTASNCIYDVALNEGTLAATGSVAARTSVDHPVTLSTGRNESVLQGTGRGLFPGMSAFSLRSWTGDHDVLLDSPIFTLLEDGAYTCDAGFAYPHLITPVLDDSGHVIGQSVRIHVSEAGEEIDIDFRIVAHGTAWDDSAVEMTGVVTNVGPAPIAVGARAAWAIALWNYPHVAWAPSPAEEFSEPWLVAEEEYLDPPHGHIVLSDSRRPSSVPSTYYVGVSCHGPSRLDPPPTPPDRIAFAHDPASGDPTTRGGPFDTCFTWHPRTPRPPTPDTGRGLPEAIAYWWGDTPETAIWLAPGESTRFTVWEWAYLENPVSCEAPPPVIAECEGASTSIALEAVDASSSGGSPLWVEWSSPDPAVAFDDPSSLAPVVTVPGLGTFELTVRAGVGPFERSRTTSVTVQDTLPPALVVDAPVTATSSTLGACRASLSVAAGVSDACDSSPVVTHVTVPDIGSGGSIASYDYPLGTTRVVFTARDASGNESISETSVTVIDDVPPVITSLDATPSTLWPPRHQLVPVRVDAGVVDDCDSAPVLALLAVTSSEPADERGDGHHLPDIEDAEWGTPDLDVSLRAERSGRGSGREYMLTYQARDASGNAVERSVIVRAPHDRALR